jgi:hypothetical protein
MEGPELYTREDLDQAACELFAGGVCFGAAGGWGLHSAWVGDWPALALAVAAAVVYFAYCRHRQAQSIDIGNRN